MDSTDNLIKKLSFDFFDAFTSGQRVEINFIKVSIEANNVKGCSFRIEGNSSFMIQDFELSKTPLRVEIVTEAFQERESKRGELFSMNMP